MSRFRLPLVLALAVGLLCVSAPAADPPPSWVGEKVFARKPGSSLVWIEGPTPGSRAASTLLYLDYTVISEDKTHVTIRLKVNGTSSTGRIAKIDVVRVDDAPAYFTKVLEATPRNDSAYIQRGWAYHLLDCTEAARDDYDVAVAARPKTWFVWNNRALMRLEAGDLDGAMDDIRVAENLDPQSPLPVYNHGLIHLRRKDYSAAILEFEAAIRIDPTYAVAYLDRGAAHEALKSFDLAQQDYETACRLDPDAPFGWSRRAWLLAAHPDDTKRNGSNAIGYAKVGCELSRWKEPICIASLAAAYAEAGRFDEAVKWQTKALADVKYCESQGAAGAAVLEQFRQKKPLRIPLQ